MDSSGTCCGTYEARAYHKAAGGYFPRGEMYTQCMPSRNNQSSSAGVERWTFETRRLIASSPTEADGTVYVGSRDNNLYALDAATGKKEWIFQTGGAVESSPTVVDGIVYVGSHDKNLYAVDAATGTEEWVFKAEEGIESSPTVVDGTVYVGSLDHNLYAVDAATGDKKWSFEAEWQVRSSPTVVDGTVYFADGIYFLYAVDAAKGTQEWFFGIEGGISSSPTVVDETVYVGSEERKIYALDSATGAEEWCFTTEGIVSSSPTVVDGTMYVGSHDNNLYAVNVINGTEKWSFETRAEIVSSPTVVDGTVYAGSHDHNLYAIDVSTGTKEWSFKTEARVESSPMVTDETVYVGSHDHNLYAITASTNPEPHSNKANKTSAEVTHSSTPAESSQTHSERTEVEKEQIPSVETVRSPERHNLSIDDLHVLANLGHGGQATIKKVQLPDSKTPPEVVAIREPTAPETITTEAVEEFLQSAETWETIDDQERNKPQRWERYEHIVGVIDTGDDLPWIAMEYMQGGDLTGVLEEHPNGLPVGQALWIGECVCKGLEIAHQLGRVHLDIKPENVLLKQTDGWPWPKLADWGLARTLGEKTGSMEGLSPEYATPEQFDSTKFGDPDQLTDIYQTGALVYALLTGRPPVTGNQYEIMQQIMSGASINPPSGRRSQLPAVVDVAVGISLEQQKADRYDSITDFRKALNSIRTNERLPRAVATRLDQ